MRLLIARTSGRSYVWIIPLILGLLAFIYCCYRSTVLSFTHDESLTLLNYVPQSLPQLFSTEMYYTNNHLLNTLLIKATNYIFGYSEFVLRLPNLLVFPIYLFFAFKTLRKLKPIVSLMAFLLMVMNPYLLDFFGLARGYGLSIGFMIMSLYFLLDYVSEKKKLSLVFYNIGAILSVLGNFSLLYYYAASLLVLNLFILIQEGYGFLSMRNKTNFLSLNYINIFFVLLLSVLIYNSISKIISAGLVVFGGKAGFVEDTVSSLLTQMSYGHIWDPILLKVIAISVVLFVLLLSIFLIFKIFLKQYQKENYSKLILVNFILLFTALGSYINHHFFGTDFLKERFALFLVPLLIVNIGVFLDHIFNNGYEKGALLIGGILNLIFLVNFLNNANLTHTHDWKYDMHTKEALKWVIEDHHKTLSNSAEKIKLANYWIFEPSLNFYRKTWDLNWLKPFDREGINVPADYYYSFQKKLPVDFIEDCTEVMKFPEPETILLKAKVKN